MRQLGFLYPSRMPAPSDTCMFLQPFVELDRNGPPVVNSFQPRLYLWDWYAIRSISSLFCFYSPASIHRTYKNCLCLLFRYCDCFANGEFCHNCNCTNCANNLEHEDERSRAIKSCLDRNPQAFHPKIGKGTGKFIKKEIVSYCRILSLT
jgi:hypothetical protein